MKKYMIDISLPEILSDEFLSLIPEQQKVVNEFFKKGLITNYALNAEQTKLWITISANSESEVWETLGKLPLISFMDVNIHELAFHHRAIVTAMPSFSLN
jgi:muconolactone delta-isomerase